MQSGRTALLYELRPKTLAECTGQTLFRQPEILYARICVRACQLYPVALRYFTKCHTRVGTTQIWLWILATQSTLRLRQDAALRRTPRIPDRRATPQAVYTTHRTSSRRI